MSITTARRVSACLEQEVDDHELTGGDLVRALLGDRAERLLQGGGRDPACMIFATKRPSSSGFFGSCAVAYLSCAEDKDGPRRAPRRASAPWPSASRRRRNILVLAERAARELRVHDSARAEERPRIPGARARLLESSVVRERHQRPGVLLGGAPRGVGLPHREDVAARGGLRAGAAGPRRGGRGGPAPGSARAKLQHGLPAIGLCFSPPPPCSRRPRIRISISPRSFFTCVWFISDCAIAWRRRASPERRWPSRAS